MMPLTLDQLAQMPNEIVFLEYRYPEYNSGYRAVAWILGWMGSKKSPNHSLYGKTWRCWAEKPTEEERQDAEWRDENV